MSNKTLIFSNATYDILKDIVTIGLPALGVLYSGMALIWGWPYAEQVVGTIALLVTFLGVIIKIASKRYQDEVAQVAVDTGTVIIPPGDSGISQ